MTTTRQFPTLPEAKPDSLALWARQITKLLQEGVILTRGQGAGNTSVRVATTANVNLANALEDGDTIDGVTLAAGNLVLVKNQSTAAENGVYKVPVSGPAPRADAFSTYDAHVGAVIAVEEGTAGGDTLWQCTSSAGGTLGTTAIAWTQVGIPLAGSITNSQLANMAQGTVKGRASTAGTGAPTDLSFIQAEALGTRFLDIDTPASITESDRGKLVTIFDGTGTLTFSAAADIGADFYCIISNTGSGVVTLAVSGSDTLDGGTTWALYPGGTIIAQKSGAASWDTYLISPMRFTFTANGTLVKPLARNIEFVDFEGWASGAAGARGGAGNGGAGGGGGGYKWLRLPISALGATETVTVGAAVAGHTTGTTGAGTNGNNTTVGSLFTAFAGGGGGFVSTRGGGGGGGGSTQAGAQGTSTGGNGGANNGGAGGGDNNNGGGADFGGSGGGGAGSGSNAGSGGNTNWGGAGGGGGSDAGGNGGNGGNSERGGGGGGGASDTGTAGAAGTSLHGGNGGAGATGAADAGDGVAPGGGGGGSESGTSGDGARGELRVTFG